MVKLKPEAREAFGMAMQRAAGNYAAARGWTNVRTATIRSWPDLAWLRSWTAGTGGIDSEDAAEAWRELGDGRYLMVFADPATGAHEHVGVQVTDGVARVIPKGLTGG